MWRTLTITKPQLWSETMRDVFCFVFTERYSMSSSSMNSCCIRLWWISNDSLSMIEPQQNALLKAQCHFRRAPSRESKAQISCIVCLFLGILYRRHSTGPSALINTSRREWLFLKMWRSRTCQFMPLYECFGMTVCSASQSFCSSC